jgi:hypothetical protein
MHTGYSWCLVLLLFLSLAIPRSFRFLILSIPVLPLLFLSQMSIGITWIVGGGAHSSEGETWRTLLIVVVRQHLLKAIEVAFPYLCLIMCRLILFPARFFFPRSFLLFLLFLSNAVSACFSNFLFQFPPSDVH